MKMREFIPGKLYKINMLLVNTATDKCLMSWMIRNGSMSADQHINEPDEQRASVIVRRSLYIDFHSGASSIFFSPGATTPIGVCILQPSSGL